MSEATRTFDPPLDWIRGHPEVLSLFFDGQSSNEPSPVYVVITHSGGHEKMVVDPDPAATQIDQWTEWVIQLSDLGALNLSSIQSMTIGIGGDGSKGKGMMYFDNIRVGTPLPSGEDPTAP